MLASSTLTGPGRALQDSVALPATRLPPATGVGVRLTEYSPMRRTVSGWLRVLLPRQAVAVQVTAVQFGRRRAAEPQGHDAGGKQKYRCGAHGIPSLALANRHPPLGA